MSSAALPPTFVAATLAVATFASLGATAQEAPPPEPSGYRMDGYRAPTPATLTGATTVSTKGAETLWRMKAAVFIDTMPRDVKPANLPAGTVWRDRPRDHVPGSVWLANVGYGVLNAEMSGYFRDSLLTLSSGDRTKPLLFYCRAECWMSWNAAKRAIEWGHATVYWYPDGTDGWEQAGLPLEPAKPYAASAPASPR